MADSSVPITAGAGTSIDTRTESTNGNHRQVIVVGDPSTNAGVAPVDATAGLKVDLGADNDVTVTGPVAVTGTFWQATQPVSLASLPALPAGTNNIGDVDVLSLPAIPAGNNNIGDVDVASIAAGDNNIGNVDIVTVPADPFGANADAASATGSISAKLRGIATALGITAFDLGSGTGGSRTLRFFQDTAQWIGGTGTDSSAVQRVSLATNVGLPAGTNNIGDVDVLTVPTDPFGANADAASATGSISAKLRGIATALGITAFDLGSGTGGSRTLRWFQDTAQWIGGAGSVTSAVQRTTLASDDPAVATLGATSGAAVITDANGTIQQYLRGLVKQWIAGTLVIGTGTNAIGTVQPGNTQNTTPWQTVSAVSTISATITRPNDTNGYVANDAFANSTSAPTSGGFTFTSAGRASGGSGTITDAVVSASAGTRYVGEIWIFDQAVTATNDNAALSVTDSDIQNLVGVIPFDTADVNAANAISYITGLGIGYTCVGTANLRFLVKIMSAVTPAAQEVLAIRIKVQN